MLLCMSLMAVIALTLDRLISTKFNCLYFCQSYDLLVVNSANVISNNNHLVPPALFNFCEVLASWHFAGSTKSFSLLSKVLINLDLSIVGCTFYYFFQCEIILAFTLLLICFVYKYQLNILNGRFSRSVEFIKGGNRSKMCQQFKPRKLSAHLTSHHSIIAAFDYLNRDIVSKGNCIRDDLSHAVQYSPSDNISYQHQIRQFYCLLRADSN
ncbi:hypothetical protein TYRP_022102 [Tyrophagus putrescentiae]|nr:hypothetical protein TYRP_022102 [Tyrophagus putrescentiae]